MLDRCADAEAQAAPEDRVRQQPEELSRLSPAIREGARHDGTRRASFEAFVIASCREKLPFVSVQPERRHTAGRVGARVDTKAVWAYLRFRLVRVSVPDTRPLAAAVGPELHPTQIG